MGLVARILDFISVDRNDANLNDVVVKPGGGANITAENFSDAGSDAQPLKTDYAYLSSDSGTGRHVVVGYIDPINISEAGEGERGILGRSVEDGSILCRVFVRNDGRVEINNNEGALLLSPDGTFNINGVIIDTQGNITTPASITASQDIKSGTLMTAPNISATISMSGGGKQLINHTHPAGNPPGNTGVNN